MKETSRTTRGRKTRTVPSRVSKATGGNAAIRPVEPVRITAEERHRMIAEAAYFRAQSRGFSGGNPEQDWREAEAEIDNAILQHSRDE